MEVVIEPLIGESHAVSILLSDVIGHHDLDILCHDNDDVRDNPQHPIMTSPRVDSSSCTPQHGQP